MPAAEQRPRRARALERWSLAGAIVLVAWSCLRFPQITISPVIDPSWMTVLVYAHEHGMQFGRDIACTYGPLGFLSIECFTPQAGIARILFELFVAAGVATGLCLTAWRMPLPWRLAALAYFVFFSSTERWGGDALYLDLGIFLWGWLCFLEQGPKRHVFVAVLSVLAAAAALVKFSFLLLALFTVVLLACDFALQRRFATAGGLVAGFMAAFVAGWLLAGQSLSILPAYFAISLDVANGYNQSVGSTSVDPSWLLLMTVSALVAVTIRVLGQLTITKRDAWRRGTLLLWFAGLLFTQWKYGCVRSDWSHAALAAGVMPLIAVCAQAAAHVRKTAALGSGAAALLCMAMPLLFMQSQIEGPVFTGHARQTFQNMAESFKVLTRPASYLREKKELYESEKQREQLPWIRATVGNATVDVFGQSQAIAVFNELNYRPRPFFQSYAANSAEAMKWNELYYQSQAAPEYVIFKLEPLDERFPSLEDARVLRELLVNYELAGGEADYLLLRRKQTGTPRKMLVKEGELHAGEKLDLQSFPDAKLWLEIELHPTLYGRLRSFVYKPLETGLTIWTRADPKTPVKFRAPAAMLAAGFLVKPLALRNDDVRDIWTGVKDESLEALSVELAPSVLAAWQSDIHFRVYRVER
jgi:hypothetical protein